jgi:hypothetical protein
MHLADLSPYNAQSSALLCVGWLAGGHHFKTGKSDDALVRQLKRVHEAGSAHRFGMAISVGLHQCDLCQFDGPTDTGELLVPGESVIYIAPRMLLHYMAAHHYSPPMEFVDAVRRCPDPDSMEFKKQLLSNGWRAQLAP